MLTDRFDLPVSTSSPAARDAYVAGCDGVLAATAGGAAHLARAIQADDGFALAHVALARATLLTGNVAEARLGAARARDRAATAPARERSHVNALCLAIEGKPVDALAATRAHLADWPRDAMVAAPATGVFGLIGFSGRPDREAEQVAFLEALKPHLGDDWWFQTVQAFALEEVGRLDEALALIERSLAGNPQSAHGAHIKSHVLYEMGEDGAALTFLDGWMPAYPREGVMHCHLSWHVAIFLLALGRTDDAWDIYRRQVHPGGSWGPALNTVTDSASFLWRAELAGQARCDQWPAVRDHALRSFPTAGIAFADVHRALACIAAGDGESLAGIVADVGERIAAGRYPAGGVVPALVSGWAAYERARWPEAIRLFEGALAETVRIGGSRAQRDLVAYTLLAAYLRDGRTDAARALIARQDDRRPSVPVAGFA